MISEGFQHLQAAQASQEITRYHLEAGIASLHAQTMMWTATPWTAIERFYDLLFDKAPSLAVLINWAVSLIMLDELDRAAAKLEEAALRPHATRLPAYHLARAQLAMRLNRDAETRSAIEAAKACQTSGPVANYIDRELSLVG